MRRRRRFRELAVWEALAVGRGPGGIRERGIRAPMPEDEQFLARRLHVPAEAFDSERRRELLEAAATRSRLSSRGAWQRLRATHWPLVQTAVAAALAWLLAEKLLGHRSPFFAPIAAIVSLAATRGQRSRRAVELMLGVAIGIGI